MCVDCVRVCIYRLTMLYKISRNHGDPGKDVMFTGYMGNIFNEQFSFTNRGMNVTFIERDSTSDCVQALMRNESDTVYSIVPYVGQDYDKVFPIGIWDDVKITIMSAYNRTSLDHVHFADILESVFKGVSLGVIVNCVVFSILTSLLLNAATWIRKMKKNERQAPSLQCGFEVLAHFFQQKSIGFSDSIRRFLCVMLSLLSFFVLLGTACIMSTELVVVEKPNVIASYKDIINEPSIKIVFGTTLSVEDMARDSGPNSANGKFWSKAKHRVHGLSGAGNDSVNVFMANMDNMFKRKDIVLSPSVFDFYSKKASCILWSTQRTFMIEDGQERLKFPYLSHDPEGEAVLMAKIMTRSFRNTRNGRLMTRNLIRSHEVGILHQMFKSLDPRNHFVPMDISKDYLEKCLTEKVVMPDVPLNPPIKIRNLVFLLQAMGVIVMATVDLLILETLWKIVVEKVIY